MNKILELLRGSDKKKKMILGIIVGVIVVAVVLVVAICVNRSDADTGESTKQKTAPKCPIDFQEYWDVNEEVYAYVEVPDADISYPILQREGDPEYYANHQIDGTEGLPGVIYTESINAKDFSDNNTVIYGHNMKNDTMFANLHKFEDKDFFEKEHEIYVYTPEHRYTYKVFAAACIGDEHLMYKYNFATADGNINFITDLQKIENSYSHYKEGTEIKNGTKLCTLLTCMPSGMENKRYIVVGYLTETIDYEKQK